MSWFQKTVTITAPGRGCHLVTDEIMRQVPELATYSIGMANLFLQHTSASLCLNENADPDVQLDLEDALNQIVPESWATGKNKNLQFRHTDEGSDDMPAHVKQALLGASLNIPITNGRLATGTWQGIYLCEHRNSGGWGGGHARKIVVTLQGERKGLNLK
jgi:secondary thiamine-phosphate synthase enzyme